MITLEGVTKRYGSTVVLDDLSLGLGGERVTSLIGPNGAGKSTVFGIVGRLITPEGGRVALDGVDLRSINPRELATRIGLLRQDNHLAARLTVQDLVEFGRFPHARGRMTPVDRGHVDRAIDYLDLGAFRSRFLDELSGGQRQRAFIAMIVAQDTQFVLLDEPLNNLDVKHMAETMRLVRRIADDLDKHVVIVLHDVNFAAAYSDRIIAMRDGLVVADAPSTEVMTSETLSRVYSTDVAIHQIDGAPVALYYR